VATRAGVTKSTVHYYFDDANELMDLSVDEVFQRVARYARESVVAASDASAALEFMIRLYMGRGKLPASFKFRESMLWPAYTAHAWKRGAKESILRELETLRSVFQLALERAPMAGQDVTARATSVHNYLTGAMVRNMVESLDRDEIARAVTALSGVEIDPAQC
jgi:AcrR family transcriptional regulator